MLAALVLDFAVLAYGDSYMGARHYLFLGGFGLRAGPVSFLLVMAFVSLRLRQRPAGHIELLAILTALAAHFFLLSQQPDLAMFLIQLASLFIVGFFGEGEKNLKILLAATPAVFLLPLACLFLSRPYQLERLLIWLDPARDPDGAGYQLTRMLKAFQAAGRWGAENASVFQDRLVLSEDPTLNALPHLALLWGNVAIAACVALLLALMWILLRRIARLENPILRNGAFGVWVFLAFNQWGGVCAPLGLAPLAGNGGLAFVGSQSLGGLLLLLAVACWAAPATGSGGIGAFLRRCSLWRKDAQQKIGPAKLADRLAKLEEASAHWPSAQYLVYADESEAILKAPGKASPLLAAQLCERIAAWREKQQATLAEYSNVGHEEEQR
jgi:hypothetical protein